MSGDTKRVLEVNQIDNLQGSTQRVKQETTLNNLRGITQRVYVVGGGGSAPVIDELNVTPSTSAQTITAPEGVDGYSPVNVAAVTSAIDANIVAENIKKDVEILGVTGSYKGQIPTGTKSITANGIYDVTDFASADVQVPTTAPAHYVEKTVDANGKLLNSTNIINLNGVTDIGRAGLAYEYESVNFPANTSVNLSDLTTISGYYACLSIFSSCKGITSADLSNLTTISGEEACNKMFYNCSNLTSVDLSSLTTISGSKACISMLSYLGSLTSINLSSLTTINGASACSSMFASCTGLISIDLSGLTTLSGYAACDSMFRSCQNLTSIDLSSLTTINGDNAFGNAFNTCTGLTTAKFNALNIVSASFAPSYGQMFGNCNKLESVEFGGLTASTFASRKDQIAYLFNNTTGSQATNGCTVHFPSNFDPSDPNHTFDASTLTGYPTFGGNASYIHVAFDLPATES